MEQCEATISFRGKDFRCDKKAEHAGKHAADEIYNGVSYGFSWSGKLDVPWAVPAPTAFEKAWEAYLVERFGPGTGPETFSTAHGFYRAGWQARGKHITGQINEQVERLNARTSAPTKGQYLSLRSLVSGSAVGDECK